MRCGARRPPCCAALGGVPSFDAAVDLGGHALACCPGGCFCTRCGRALASGRPGRQQPLVRVDGVRSDVTEEPEAFRTTLARLLGFWLWAGRPPEHHRCVGVLGLCHGGASEHVVLQPIGPGRPICAWFGCTSTVDAGARLCTPQRRFQERVRSALRERQYAAAIVAAPRRWCVCGGRNNFVPRTRGPRSHAARHALGGLRWALQRLIERQAECQKLPVSCRQQR